MIYVLSCLVWGSIYLALNSSQASMWGEKRLNTQHLRFPFLKNKFSNIRFSPFLWVKGNKLYFKERGRGKVTIQNTFVTTPSAKLQETRKEKYQFSKSIKQIIKVSVPNDCQKKKSQFVSIKTKEDKISYGFSHVVCVIYRRTVCRSLNYCWSLILFPSYTSFSSFLPLLAFVIVWRGKNFSSKRVEYHLYYT